MRFPKSGSISRSLTWLVMVAVLPALMIFLYSGVERRQQSIEAAKRDLLLLTHSMAAVQKGLTDSARQTLSTLALTREIRGMDGRASAEVFRALLERNPEHLNFALTDLNGDVVASGRPFTSANLADRKHFREALATKAFAVGEYVIARTVAAPTFTYAYPVLDEEGRPKGVLTTALRLDRFAGFYEVSNLPGNSFVAVTDHRGIRLSYHPLREETNPVGKPINAQNWEIAHKSESPGIFIRPGSDGARRIFAFEPVRLGPSEAPYMFMWAGIPEDDVLRPANTVLIRNLLLLGFATLMALAISRFLGRRAFVSPISSLIATTKSFAEGNLNARSGLVGAPDEIGTLAAAFDDMAAALIGSQQTLREREAFIRAVLDDLPIGVAVNSVEPTVTFTYMNDNFPRFYGTTREALSGPDAFWEAVYEDPEFREKIKQRVLADCASGDPERMYWVEVPITRKGGRTTYISARNKPILDNRSMISTVWDVTEQKRAGEERQKLQAQLAQAQKLESVGRLAGGVAHDFNNMLTVILGHTEMALRHVDASQRVHGDLLAIDGAAKRSAELIRQLLAFARKQTVSPKVLDLNDALAGMLKMLQRLIGEHITLSWTPGADLWPVKIDPSQVDQLLANLCVNARDAISGVGTVAIATQNVVIDEAHCRGNIESSPGEYVVLTLSDTGCGMDNETLEKVFEPFFTTKGVGKGTGLGLATVFGIVKQNQGFIDVRSEPGKGAAFRIYLPRSSGETTAETSAESLTEMPRGRGETVLLVEDDPTVMSLCQNMLASLGYAVVTAGTPGEAVRLAAEQGDSIHLLLTDVVMPEMNGRQLAEKLRSAHPHLKCVFMSGYTADIMAVQGVLDEEDHFLQKPFKIRTLAQRLRRALDGG